MSQEQLTAIIAAILLGPTDEKFSTHSEHRISNALQLAKTLVLRTGADIR